MNYRLKIIILSLLWCSTTKAKETITNFSRAWIEKCCISIMVGERDPKNYTKDQEEATLSFIYWVNGFMVGANSMVMAPAKDQDRLELAFPPEEWLDTIKIAPKILAFCREHPEIPGDAKAREVMTAWYYINHPKSTDRHKIFAGLLLTKLKDPHRYREPYK